MEFYSLAVDELDDDRKLTWPPQLQRRARDQCELYVREGITPLTLAGCEEKTVRGFVVFPEHPSMVVSCSWPVCDSPEILQKLALGLLHTIRVKQLVSIVTMLEDQPSSNRTSLVGFERLTTIARYQLDQSSFESSIGDDQGQDALRFAPLDDLEMQAILERTRADSLDCPELHSFLSWDERLAELRRLSPDQIRVEIALLEHEHEALGIAISSIELQHQECEVNYLGILPEHRGQGWGQTLLRRLLKRHFEGNVKRIRVHVDSRNTYARRVYESTEFRLSGEFPLWISYWDSLF